MSDNDGIRIRFQAYTGDALPVSVEVQASDLDTFDKLLTAMTAKFPQLGSFGMLLREPPSGSLRPREYRIIGWMRGQTQDSKNGEMMPAVFLYCDLAHLDFSICTVYHEMLEKLPPDIDWQHAQLVGNAAPPTAKARTMRSWNDCDMRVVLMPQIGRDGNPIVDKKGDTRYKFSHVVGYSAPDADDQGAPPSSPSAPEAAQAPSQPTGTTGQDAGHRAPPTPQPGVSAPRPVQPAGEVKLDAAGKRINTDTKSCPMCFAPPGKRHGDNCTVGLTVPPGDADKGEAFSLDPMAKYAKAYSDPNLTLTADTSALIAEMRHLDKTSTKSMTITVPADGENKAVPGQYNFLAGLVKKLATDMGSTDDEIHNKVLSFIFGGPIRTESAPGENAKVLIDRLYTGSAKRGPNPNFHQGTVNSVMEIIGACMFMDTLEDEELEYAA